MSHNVSYAEQALSANESGSSTGVLNGSDNVEAGINTSTEEYKTALVIGDTESIAQLEDKNYGSAFKEFVLEGCGSNSCYVACSCAGDPSKEELDALEEKGEKYTIKADRWYSADFLQSEAGGSVTDLSSYYAVTSNIHQSKAYVESMLGDDANKLIESGTTSASALSVGTTGVTTLSAGTEVKAKTLSTVSAQTLNTTSTTTTSQTQTCYKSKKKEYFVEISYNYESDGYLSGYSRYNIGEKATDQKTPNYAANYRTYSHASDLYAEITVRDKDGNVVDASEVPFEFGFDIQVDKNSFNSGVGVKNYYYYWNNNTEETAEKMTLYTPCDYNTYNICSRDSEGLIEELSSSNPVCQNRKQIKPDECASLNTIKIKTAEGEKYIGEEYKDSIKGEYDWLVDMSDKEYTIGDTTYHITTNIPTEGRKYFIDIFYNNEIFKIRDYGYPTVSIFSNTGRNVELSFTSPNLSWSIEKDNGLTKFLADIYGYGNPNDSDSTAVSGAKLTITSPTNGETFVIPMVQGYIYPDFTSTSGSDVLNRNVGDIGLINDYNVYTHNNDTYYLTTLYTGCSGVEDSFNSYRQCVESTSGSCTMETPDNELTTVTDRCWANSTPSYDDTEYFSVRSDVCLYDIGTKEWLDSYSYTATAGEKIILGQTSYLEKGKTYSVSVSDYNDTKSCSDYNESFYYTFKLCTYTPATVSSNSTVKIYMLPIKVSCAYDSGTLMYKETGRTTIGSCSNYDTAFECFNP